MFECDENGGPAGQDLAAAVEPRMRVKSGSMTLVVTEIKAAEEAVRRLCLRYAGFVDLSGLVSGTGSLILKVPAENSIAYSTLNLTLILSPEVRSGVEPPSLAAGLRAAGDFTLNFPYYFLLVILYTLIIGVPLLLAAALVYVAGFGRLGLIVKLFRALRPKKKT